MSSNIKYFHKHDQVQQQQLEQQSIFVKDSLNNTEIDASIYLHPTLTDYYHNVTPFMTLSIFVAVILVILNISIFSTTVSRLKRNVNSYYRGHSILLSSLYPIICCAALTTILLPKTWLICHTVMHLSFTVGAPAFCQLCYRYVDSEISFLKETNGAATTLNTPPCCCCCLCLPTFVPSKAKLALLRYMICQMPLVQGSIMLVLNVIYYREKALYHNVSIYFMPFIACSILMGLWSLNITVRMINGVKSNYNLMKKLFCLQLIMLLCKLQYLVLHDQLDHLVLGGEYPINHTIYKQAIINLLILCEMVLVSMLFQNAYKIPT